VSYRHPLAVLSTRTSRPDNQHVRLSYRAVQAAEIEAVRREMTATRRSLLPADRA
jgi:hypothetical protein